MPRVIDITPTHLVFRFQHFHGEIRFDTFINFTIQTSFERLACLDVSDPSRAVSDIQEFSRIHTTVTQFVNDLQGAIWEKLATQYWLASLFLTYFKSYRMDSDDSLCRRAWVYLLRMRCVSLIALHSLESEERSEFCKRKDIENLIPEALREWRTFIQDQRYHFMFRQVARLEVSEEELRSLEEEMQKIIYSDLSGRRESLHQFFLQHTQGKDVLRRIFIVDWLLNDRYDWIGAFRLWSHYHHNSPIAMMIALLFLGIGVGAYFAGSLPCFGWILWGIAVGFVLVLGSEDFIQLMVPRLWAAVAVGYLPVMVAQEIWKLATKISGCERAGYWLVSIVLSVFYLRWEIGNRLRATPDLNWWVPIKRAVVLTVIGGVAAFMIGFFLLDVAGEHFVDIYLMDQGFSHKWRIPGVWGTVYPDLLLTFSPIALLLGVVLQIFWQERAVTAPV